MIEFTIPGTAPSTPNLREHHMVRARRMKAQRAAVARRMPKWMDGPLLIVRLTRVGPRTLDSDNLAAALKGHRDAVAACLRVDDASPLVRWEYHQARGDPAVVVNVWRAGEQAPEYLNDSATPKGVKRAPKAAYVPPRSVPVDAACEAGETFAPGPLIHVRDDSGFCAACAATAPRPAQGCIEAAGVRMSTTPLSIPILHVRRDDGYCACGAGPEEGCSPDWRWVSEVAGPEPHPDTCRCVTCGAWRIAE